MSEGDGERQGRALRHRRDLPLDVVHVRADEHVVEIAEAELSERVRDRLLDVGDQDRPVLLKIARVLRDAWDDETAATKNGG
jgi:hypothetical protein